MSFARTRDAFAEAFYEVYLLIKDMIEGAPADQIFCQAAFAAAVATPLEQYIGGNILYFWGSIDESEYEKLTSWQVLAIALLLITPMVLLATYPLRLPKHENENRLEEKPIKNSNEERLIAVGYPLEDIPENLVCPITYRIFDQAVVASDGCIYEEQAILKWKKQKNVSPLTNLPFKSKECFPLVEKRENVLAFVESKENDYRHRWTQQVRSVLFPPAKESPQETQKQDKVLTLIKAYLK